MSKLAQMLAEAVWTRALTPEQRRRVEAETFSRICPKGSHVFHHGERVDHWMGVVDGLAKMTMIGRDGRATTFVAVGTGAWFGEAGHGRVSTLRDIGELAGGVHGGAGQNGLTAPRGSGLKFLH